MVSDTGFYAMQDDRLRLVHLYASGVSGATSVLNRVEGHILVEDARGQVHPYSVTLNGADAVGTRVVTTTTGPRIAESGRIVGAGIDGDLTNVKRGSLYVILDLIRPNSLARVVSAGYLYNGYRSLGLGEIEESDWDRTWCFQGSITEDGTAGTHVCSLTVTPGAGNELTLEYGQVLVGNTATAQTMQGIIDDGANVLVTFVNPENLSATTASTTYIFPRADSETAAALATGIAGTSGAIRFPISGTMRIRLLVTTTAISVTQTFALVCRIRGRTNPTATLADSVGTPVLTTNTNTEF